jgi:hypothetical protein
MPGFERLPRQHEERGDQMRQTTTARVRLDERKNKDSQRDEAGK